MKKRNKEFNDSYKVLSDKAREKAERRYHAQGPRDLPAAADIGDYDGR